MTDIAVLQRDIDQGRPGNVLCCPVALAMRRALHRQVVVYPNGWRYAGSWPGHLRPLQPVAVRFISDLDTHHPVRPFTFSVEP